MPLLPRLATHQRTAEEMMGIIRSTRVKLESAMVPKIATGRPRTIQMLKILLPTRLPTSSSLSLRLAAVMVVTISGKAVPKLMMVRAITRSDRPMLLAMVVAELTTNSPPAITPASPRTTRIRDLPSLYLGFSNSFLELRLLRMIFMM